MAVRFCDTHDPAPRITRTLVARAPARDARPSSPLGLCAPTPRFSRQIPRNPPSATCRSPIRPPIRPPPTARLCCTSARRAATPPQPALRQRSSLCQRTGSASSRPVCVHLFCTTFYIHHPKSRPTLPLATTAQNMAPTIAICHTPHLHSKLPSTLPWLAIKFSPRTRSRSVTPGIPRHRTVLATSRIYSAFLSYTPLTHLRRPKTGPITLLLHSPTTLGFS
ncbi:hypothetical protein C8J57DRAFT_1638091 [Mycena rebaudengoi]|nr:hypothetical protein C8J57DRAFT_1638091 [Mycena rebaudengoi]